ncbi:uncharacterized protein LOC144878330 [Branchiostoma floridae x Branchiostoma japonicum]
MAVRSGLCVFNEEHVLRRVESEVNIPPVGNTRLVVHIMGRYNASHRVQCSQLCFLNEGCQSYNYNYHAGDATCELSDQRKDDFPLDAVEESGWDYYDRYSLFIPRVLWYECSRLINPCENGGVCTRKVLMADGEERQPCDPLCVCPVSTAGQNCGTCDWQQVFATVRGTGQQLIDAWNAGLHDEMLHNKSLLVHQWETLGIKKVKVVLETSGDEDVEMIFNGENTDKFNWFIPVTVKVLLETSGDDDVELIFNGENTDKSSWFSQSRLLSSPWTDLPGETANFFSVEGELNPVARRSFYINQQYGGCAGDEGWLAVGETGPGAVCDWERASYPELPALVYSKSATHVNWNDESQVGRADRMVIYIKTCQ